MNPEVDRRTGNIIRRASAVLLIGFVSVTAACGGTGFGEKITDCHGNGSDTEATWKGQPGYHKDTDPENLMAYAPHAAAGLGIYDDASHDIHNHDKLNKLGKFVCYDDDFSPDNPHAGSYVLTRAGEAMSETCVGEGVPQPFDQPPVKQYC